MTNEHQMEPSKDKVVQKRKNGSKGIEVEKNELTMSGSGLGVNAKKDGTEISGLPKGWASS